MITPARAASAGNSPSQSAGRVHPPGEVRHDPLGQERDRRVVDAVPDRVVRVPAVARGGDHRHARLRRHAAHEVRPPPEPDRRQLHDRPDAGGLRLADLLGDPLRVLDLAALQRRRRDEQVVVRVDDAEAARGERSRDGDDVGFGHGGIVRGSPLHLPHVTPTLRAGQHSRGPEPEASPLASSTGSIRSRLRSDHEPGM